MTPGWKAKHGAELIMIPRELSKVSSLEGDISSALPPQKYLNEQLFHVVTPH